MTPAARIPLSLWEREKEHIRALYLDQDKTLDELVKCMAEDHGFYATKPQYIRRLGNWKMRKYSNKEEWEYVDSLVKKRKLEGKESEITMDGKPISVKKLKKELGRYGQPSSSKEPCLIPPNDALKSIVACTPPATASVSFDIKLIKCTTVPWFPFHDSFAPKMASTFKHMAGRDIRQSALAKQLSKLASSILGNGFSASIAAEKLRKTMPQRPGVDADALQVPFPAAQPFVQIICWAIYQISNNLLSDSQTDKFLHWIIDHSNMQFLRQFTHINDPVTRVLKSNLLLSAIRSCNAEAVQLLLDNGTNPGVVHRIGRETALQLAVECTSGESKIVQMLLEHGACPNTIHPQSILRLSPLLLAMKDLLRKSSIAEMLILEGADVNVSYCHLSTPSGLANKTPLLVTTDQGDASLTDLLLQKGANPNSFHFVGSALHTAVRNNRAGLVDALLKAGADANIPCGEGNQANLNLLSRYLARCASHKVLDSILAPIDVAYKHGNEQIVNILLQAGAHADGCSAFIGNFGQKIASMALQEAKHKGNHRLVDLFLRAGVLSMGQEVAREDDGLFNQLLERGAGINPSYQASRQISDLTWSILQQDHGEFERLMSKGAKPDLPQDFPTPLITAIVSRSMSFSMVLRLIKAGADVNKPSDFYYNRQLYVHKTPLQAAVTLGDTEIINFLLDSGAAMNHPQDSIHLGSALSTAVSHQNEEVVQLLLSRGANPNRALPLATALPDIGRPVDLEVFRLLLSHKAEVNPQSLETSPPQSDTNLPEATSATAVYRLRLTPLQAALERGHDNLAWMFLEAGADFHAPASWGGGKTALQAAAMNGNMPFLEHFVSRGVDVNAPPAGNCGATALQFAAIQGHYNVVVFLLENGADVNAPGAAEGGRTALQGASEQGRLDIVHLLLENDQEEESLGRRCQDAAVFAEENGHLVIAEILRGWKKSS